MDVHLIDGTYELFRQYYGLPAGAPRASEVAAARGVCVSVVALLERGVTHVGVASDHVIESFRNQLWPGYKTSDGMPEELLAQIPVMEQALAALGVCVWPMVDVEADDALASAAAVLSDDGDVGQVRLCTPDKDLAQCVSGTRVVQFDLRSGAATDEDGVRARLGVSPASVPDWLALVGDSADGFPGLPGWGKQSASAVLAHYGRLEEIPDSVFDWDPVVRRAVRGAPRLAGRLAAERDLAGLFKVLATLRVDRSLLRGAEDVAWRGPTGRAGEACEALRAPALAARAAALAPR